MTVRIRFHDEAVAELRDAVNYYETERPGLGARLLAHVEARLGDAQLMPAIVTSIADAPPDVPAKRVRLSQFPFVLIILIEKEELLVLSVSHSRREPLHWLSRAKGPDPP